MWWCTPSLFVVVTTAIAIAIAIAITITIATATVIAISAVVIVENIFFTIKEMKREKKNFSSPIITLLNWTKLSFNKDKSFQWAFFYFLKAKELSLLKGEII